jgi:exonuclease VII small subunit
MQNSAGTAMPSQKKMEKLAATAKRLNQASDELNEVIESFEDQLQTAGVGLSYWFGDDELGLEQAWLLAKGPVETNEQQEEEQAGHQLGYTKVDGKWKLAVRPVLVQAKVIPGSALTYYRLTPEGREIALSSAPRLIRAEAAPLFGHLADALEAKMEAFIQGIEYAKKLSKEG